MALGAYSVVRYSNHLNDQRVNLGVLVWHPLDGFRSRFSSNLDRAQAVDPRLTLRPLKEQLDHIAAELRTPEAGKQTLGKLSEWFKEGLEVAQPYPAQIQSADEMTDHLYQMLVSPVTEFRRASTQHQFERKIQSALKHAAKTQGVKYEEIGQKKFGHLVVNVGMRTVVDDRRILWRALSLQAHDQYERQLAFAKATAMDMNIVQGPKQSALAGLRESVNWLETVADNVFVVEDVEAFPGILEKALTR